jgi:hypothetical protein
MTLLVPYPRPKRLTIRSITILSRLWPWASIHPTANIVRTTMLLIQEFHTKRTLDLVLALCPALPFLSCHSAPTAVGPVCLTQKTGLA